MKCRSVRNKLNINQPCCSNAVINQQPSEIWGDGDEDLMAMEGRKQWGFTSLPGGGGGGGGGTWVFRGAHTFVIKIKKYP